MLKDSGKSTIDSSFIMILLWFLGDGSKLFYFIYLGTKIQFIIGGAGTMLVDLVVLLQFFYYSLKQKRNQVPI